MVWVDWINGLLVSFVIGIVGFVGLLVSFVIGIVKVYNRCIIEMGIFEKLKTKDGSKNAHAPLPPTRV
jgi:predicted cobalt transporter CbtA